jgi:site-specific recombinase XerD
VSEANTHAVPDDGQEPEQRRNIAPKPAENSVAEPRKRRKSIPKTTEECERVKYLKLHTSPLRERFIEDMKYNSLKENTRKKYLNAVFDFVAHYNKPPQNISDEEVREYFNYIINVRQMDPQSQIGHRAALVFLYEKTLNLFRPFLHIFHPQKTKSYRDILAQRELKYFLSLIRNPIFRIMTELMCVCGLRYFEVSHLTVHDIDRANGYLIIRGKGGKIRKVPLPNKMLKHLTECWRIHRHPELLFPLCEINEETGKVIFFRAKYIPLGKMQALYDSICSEHAIKNKRITPHVFRHSCATHLIELGASTQVVQNILGHRNIRTTTQYIHDSAIISRREAEFIEKLADILPD